MPAADPCRSPTRRACPTEGGWYDVGTVTVPAGDNSTAVTLSLSGGGSSPDLACLGYADSDIYDPTTDELYKTVDRDGRATIYQYNDLGQETGERWYATSNTSASPTETITTAYTADGQIQSTTDQVGSNAPATDSYVYDDDENVITDTQTVPGLTPTVTLNEQYTDGNRTSLAAVLTTGTGTAAVTNNDLVNTYQYEYNPTTNPLGQMSEVSQSSAAGSGTNDAVARNRPPSVMMTRGSSRPSAATTTPLRARSWPPPRMATMPTEI